MQRSLISRGGGVRAERTKKRKERDKEKRRSSRFIIRLRSAARVVLAAKSSVVLPSTYMVRTSSVVKKMNAMDALLFCFFLFFFSVFLYSTRVGGNITK